MTSYAQMPRENLTSRGFTLMELLITVAILSIVVAVAYPNYLKQTERARRTDATAALLNLAAAQEKFFLQNNGYTTELGDSGLGIKSTSENGYYDLSVTLSGGGFVATATADSDGSQKHDIHCKTFSIDHTGAKSSTQGSGSGAEPSDSCW